MNGVKKDRSGAENGEAKVAKASQTVSANGKHSTTKKEDDSVWTKQSLTWLKYVIVLAFATRFYMIHFPPNTVFDEMHHGKFASWYRRREYYVDVHPPLGRLVFAAAAELSGYDGHFDFDKQDNMTFLQSTFPHVALRSVSGVMSVCTCALVYAILIEMKFSLQAAIVGAFFVIFDNSLTIMGRIFILESQMICFMTFACFSWVKFRSFHSQPFSTAWWSWLVATGVGIGLTLGVKFVGLFMMLSIGIFTLYDLWDVCNVKKTPSDLVALYHWLARGACLILIPIVLFIIPYWVHFKLLYKSGNGDDFMSVEFQTTLEGNKITNNTFPVYYGSTIRIKSRIELCFLHSHIHRYPQMHTPNKVSSSGQQVTGYAHKDENNLWIIYPANADIDPLSDEFMTKRMPVRSGDYIRLMHNATGNWLLTHNVASPLTMTNQEVTAVEWNRTLEHPNTAKTLWRLDVTDSVLKIETDDDQKVTSKLSIFRIMHNDSNCALLNYQQNLPQWGYGQREINSAKSEADSTLWSIDDVTPPNGWTQEEVDRETRDSKRFDKIKPSFWSKFVELVRVSFEINNGLVDRNSKTFDPIGWPLMTKGMHFWFGKDHQAKIYLLGNPFAWYISLLTLPVLIGALLIDIYANLRGKQFLKPDQKSFIYSKGIFFLVCYLLHYLPFFMMGRILYFHHYIPSYLFNALIFTAVYQTAMICCPALGRKSSVGIICACLVATFWYFMPLTYGFEQTQDQFRSMKWRKGWDFI